jgi:DNA topoisomerase IA
VFGEEFLSPLKKSPPAKNVTSDSTEHSLLTLQNVDETKLSKKELSDMKKSEKDSKDKESQSPKNAQNAHEAIRPAETDGKVRTVMYMCVRECVSVYVCVRESV